MSHHGGDRSSKAPAGTRLTVLSGCSGGGKSTLLEALAQRGIATVAEPGRRIVQQERAAGGGALPWHDLAAFARRALALARADRAEALARGGATLFDRGMVDAAAALERATGAPAAETLGPSRLYDSPVFLVPPWPEIYRQDGERAHGFDAAVVEYEHLVATYSGLGYAVLIVPRLPVAERVAFVMGRLGITGS